MAELGGPLKPRGLGLGQGSKCLFVKKVAHVDDFASISVWNSHSGVVFCDPVSKFPRGLGVTFG